MEQFVNLLLNDKSCGQKMDMDSEFTQGIRRLQLCSGSNSTYLNQMIKMAMKER